MGLQLSSRPHSGRAPWWLLCAGASLAALAALGAAPVAAHELVPPGPGEASLFLAPPHPTLAERLLREGRGGELTAAQEAEGEAVAQGLGALRGLPGRSSSPAGGGALGALAMPPSVPPATRGPSDPQVLAIMVQFPEDLSISALAKSRTKSHDELDALLFSTAPSATSVYNYYYEQSGGTFLFQGKVVGAGGASDSGAVWLTLPKSLNYYAGTSHGLRGAFPTGGRGIVADAIRALTAANFDFGPYLDPSSHTIPYLIVIHAGQGAEVSAATYDIWSHESSLGSSFGGGVIGTVSGSPLAARVDRYAIVPELGTSASALTNRGVIAHEFGHILGLPDLYDVRSKSCGDGPWTLMAGGSWGGPSNDGSTPASLDPWSRTLLGWVTPVEVTSTTLGLSLDQIAGDLTPSVYKIYPAGLTGRREYFLVENRQIGLTGKPDAALPGTGLLVWHIDEAIANPDSNLYRKNKINAKGIVAHPAVAVVEADVSATNPQPDLFTNDCATTSAAGDPFASTSDDPRFQFNTLPSSRLWSTLTSGIAITNFSPTGSTMTADVAIDTVGGKAAPAYTLPVAKCTATATRGCVKGQVKDSAGEAQPHASVTMWSPVTGGTYRTKTDYAGNFAILAIPSSSYQIYATVVGANLTGPIAVAPVTAATDLVQDVTLQLPTSVIRGRITSSATAAGIANASIRIKTDNATTYLEIQVGFPVRTNSEGYYQIPIKAGQAYDLYVNGVFKTTLAPTVPATVSGYYSYDVAI